ncbi:WG repeat-containing protein [uncultured Duncaniella sp.]|uniref:WG repeat-containing protein n=1 Tax=uncultured Duncaniella sp. TaxID=2768039 RepID=UPI00351CC3D5
MSCQGQKNGKWGLIDIKGNIVTDCIYDYAKSFEDGFYTVKKDGKWFKIDTKGNVVE